MSKPIHTPGPVEVIMETDRHVDGAPFKDYFIATSGEKRRTIADTYNCDFVFTEEDRHANARRLAAAYNAFDSAGKALDVNAVELAERMADGGIAELFNQLYGVSESLEITGECLGDMEGMRAILAKVKGGTS